MTNPVPDSRVLDVLELGADRAGIDRLQRRDHFTQRHRLVIEEELGRNAQIEIFLAEAELAQAEQRIFRTLLGQRIYFRDGVTESAVSVDEAVHPRLQRTLLRLLTLRRSAIPQR